MPVLVRIDTLDVVPAEMEVSSDSFLRYTKYKRNGTSHEAAGLFVTRSTVGDAPGLLLDYASYTTLAGVQVERYVPIAQYSGESGEPSNFREDVTAGIWFEPDDDVKDCIVTQSMLARALKKACPFNFTSTTSVVSDTSDIPRNTILLHRSKSNTIDAMYFSNLDIDG